MKDTKDKLLENGYNLFREKGYNATGIQELTDSVGVSKGSFYNHFRHKELFAERLIRDFGEQLCSEYAEALGKGDKPPIQRLKQFYRKKAEAVANQEHFKKGCVISNLCQEVADKYDNIARSIDYSFNGMKKFIKLCLDEAVSEGSLAEDKDTDLLAEAILNSWNGALMRVKASQNKEALHSFMYTLNILLE